MSRLRHPPNLPLAQRVSVFADRFSLQELASVYTRRGSGPGVTANHRIPQRFRCIGARLLSRSYIWNRLDVHGSAHLEWPVPATEHVAVVELRGETLCVRMRRLLFFEPSLQMSTIVNTQVQWCAFDSPFVSCISGHGLVAFRMDGPPEFVSRQLNPTITTEVPKSISLARLVAWSRDSKFRTVAKGDIFNAVTFASCAVEVVESSLVIGLRGDSEVESDGRLLSRVWRLVVP
jgi:hypothetical protein